MACFTLEKLEDLSGQGLANRRAVTTNDASQPVATHLNNGSHCVSDKKIRALCPISGSNYSHKRHEMRLISKLGTVHPLGLSLSDTLIH